MSDKQKRRKAYINQDHIRKIFYTQNAAYFPNVKQDDDNIFFVFPTKKTTQYYISHQPNEKIVNGVELPKAGFNTPIFDAFGPIKNNMIELVQKYNVDQRGARGDPAPEGCSSASGGA